PSPPMPRSDIIRDAKEDASGIFAGVSARTKNLFPEQKYWPLRDAGGHLRLSPGRHAIAVGAEGVGTKPELAERRSTLEDNAVVFDTLAFDVVAMVADDAARDGHFTVGIVNALDVNDAKDPAF